MFTERSLTFEQFFLVFFSSLSLVLIFLMTAGYVINNITIIKFDPSLCTIDGNSSGFPRAYENQVCNSNFVMFCHFMVGPQCTSVSKVKAFTHQNIFLYI